MKKSHDGHGLPLGLGSTVQIVPNTLVDLLKEASQRQDESSGLIDTDGSFRSWLTVHGRVKGLAAALIEAGVAPGDRVVVAHPRSSSSFEAVHAILHAGAVMVPLDPLGAPEAIAKVLASVQPAAVIGATNTLVSRMADHLTSTTIHVIFNGDAQPLADLGIESARVTDFESAATTLVTSALPSPAPDDVAYIIFTSGSTGVPKGIMHSHASALGYARAAADVHGLTATDRIAATTPLHFDISTFDLYSAPYAGASTVSITEPENRFPASLTKRLQDEGVTVVFCTPYQLQQLGQRGDLPNRDLSGLRQVAFGGEAFSPQTLVELMALFPGAAWLNSYGPAEVNGVITHEFEVHPESLATVPIGVPMPGVDVRLVDDADALVAPGESGELLISSPSMMLGYWDRPELNDEIFAVVDGARFYRTGDMAHVDPDGLYQFEGRRDNRIKIRGVRIELEEIERVLGDAPGVLYAVAGRVDDDSGMQHIVGWVVPQPGAGVDPSVLTEWCRSRLPANAVPTSYVEVDSLPSTATGKIDRATLRASAPQLGA